MIAWRRLSLALSLVVGCKTATVQGSRVADTAAGPSRVAVVTQHNDNRRSGANLQETVLTPAVVNPASFGKLYSRPVQGRIFAQPLYVSGVVIGGTPRNIVYVETMHNMVYAFDADDVSPTAAPLWTAEPTRLGPSISYLQFTNPDTKDECHDVGPEVGITSTPAIDLGSNTMYLVVKQDATGAPDHSGVGFWIHALDLSTGADKVAPKQVVASAPGQTPASAGNAPVNVDFSAFWQLNRPGLLLNNGELTIAFGSTCDYTANWHGWIMNYDVNTLSQDAVWLSTPYMKVDNGVHGNYGFDKVPNVGGMGGIWQGGMGLASDGDYIYAIIGNGDVGLLDAAGKPEYDYGKNFGNSFVKLDALNLNVTDWFTPYNAAWMNLRDFDLGSSGAMVMPDDVTAQPLVVGGGKQGILYAVNRNNLGKFVTNGTTLASLNAPWDDHSNPKEDLQIPQKFEVMTERHGNGYFNIHGSPVYWQSPAGPTIYIWAEEDHLKSFVYDKGRGKFGDLAGHDGTPAATDAYSYFFAGMPGGMLSVSANGSQDGIIWATHLASDPNTHKILKEGVICAFAADPRSGKLAELWDSNMNQSRDHVGSPGKFAAPTVANGKVFVASNGYNFTDKDYSTYLTDQHALLQVYGLLGSTGAAVPGATAASTSASAAAWTPTPTPVPAAAWTPTPVPPVAGATPGS